MAYTRSNRENFFWWENYIDPLTLFPILFFTLLESVFSLFIILNLMVRADLINKINKINNKSSIYLLIRQLVILWKFLSRTTNPCEWLDTSWYTSFLGTVNNLYWRFTRRRTRIMNNFIIQQFDLYIILIITMLDVRQTQTASVKQ